MEVFKHSNMVTMMQHWAVTGSFFISPLLHVHEIYTGSAAVILVYCSASQYACSRTHIYMYKLAACSHNLPAGGWECDWWCLLKARPPSLNVPPLSLYLLCVCVRTTAWCAGPRLWLRPPPPALPLSSPASPTFNSRSLQSGFLIRLGLIKCLSGTQYPFFSFP